MNARASTLAFDEAVEDVSGGNIKVPRGDYLQTGPFPVVDQGQDHVGGFAEDASFLVRGQAPWIVFGDHTRALKYLDVPFCMGADGIKVLKPRNPDRLDAKFLYYFLSAAEVPNAGYSRHFKFLRRLEVPLPSLDEQRRIAALLDKADALRRKRKCALKLLDSLTHSIFLEMFGDPIDNPRKFPVVSLESLVATNRKITYGILKPGPDTANGVPYIRVLDMSGGKISSSSLKRTTAQIASEYRRSALKTGDLLMSIRGHVGRTAIVPSECDGANITQDTARLAISGANVEFVRAQIELPTSVQWMARRTKGAAVKGINLSDVRVFPVLMASEKEQNEFACSVIKIKASIEAGIGQLKIASEFFASLQSRAFSGQL